MFTKKVTHFFFFTLLFFQSIHASSDIPSRASLEDTPLGLYKSLGINLMKGGTRNLDLPEEFFLDDVTPCKDQGPLGTCVSFAAAACVECFHPETPVSEAEFTILAETQLYEGDCRPGLCLLNALHLSQKMGFTPQDRLPYSTYLKKVAGLNGIDTRTFDWNRQLEQRKQSEIAICYKHKKNSDIENYNITMANMSFKFTLMGDSAQDVTPYRISDLKIIHHVSRKDLSTALSCLSRNSRVEPIQEENSIGKAAEADIGKVKTSLFKGQPVAAALPVFSGCWDSSVVDEYSPYIKLPKKGNKYTGSHAVVLTGYDDKQEAFHLKNSWGQDWGAEGNAWIPYEYVKLYSTELTAVIQ